MEKFRRAWAVAEVLERAGYDPFEAGVHAAQSVYAPKAGEDEVDLGRDYPPGQDTPCAWLLLPRTEVS